VNESSNWLVVGSLFHDLGTSVLYLEFQHKSGVNETCK
jgi:hypothetical protein